MCSCKLKPKVLYLAFGLNEQNTRTPYWFDARDVKSPALFFLLNFAFFGRKILVEYSLESQKFSKKISTLGEV